MSVNQVAGQSIDIDSFRREIERHIRYSLGREPESATKSVLYEAVALAARDLMTDGMFKTEKRVRDANAKRLYYLSMEFLMGRSLGNNLLNLGIFDLCRETLCKMGVDLEEIRTLEVDAALGNGGLGRLAACFLDSLASLNLPGYGYGIHYEFGLFKQEIHNGFQVEKPDNWLATKSPWEIERPEEAHIIPVYGRIEHSVDRRGHYNPMWMAWKVLIGVPHDMPIVGYGGRTVNFLRLFSARSSEEFDMQIFNEGDYIQAVRQKIASETISKVLYPSDSVRAGRELRLVQEYFLVACAIRDIVRRYKTNHTDFNDFPSQVAIQMNDTHPALTVAELMRTLIDENDMDWEPAWEITQATLGYTNHTLMSEALEKWPVSLIEYVLPRHLQIIYEINRRFMDAVEAKWPGDGARKAGMSVIEEGRNKQVRMAHLAILGSHSVNGVSALHSELIKTTLVPDFYSLWPEKFNNKTNGVTQRRWLLKANPGLADLITDTIGDRWITHMDDVRKLEPFADDASFRERFHDVKRANKKRLAKMIKDTTGVVVDPSSLFDVQVKRMHEYKRQLLNVMHIIDEYLSMVEDNKQPVAPRTYVFAGKAAPGYWAAKQIIYLINSVARVINNDKRVNNMLKVVFIPDYRVSIAETIIPAADLSEQISTAGTEASGTGNMKFAMNGAVTIGTLDGANIEICEEVGDENIFIFGLKTAEIQRLQRENAYQPWDLYNRDATIHRVLDSLSSSLFSPLHAGLFGWIKDSMLNGGDPYFHLADLGSYIEVQDTAGREYQNTAVWDRKAVLNVARIGKFSSDRTIGEYAEGIWHIKPV